VCQVFTIKCHFEVSLKNTIFEPITKKEHLFLKKPWPTPFYDKLTQVALKSVFAIGPLKQLINTDVSLTYGIYSVEVGITFRGNVSRQKKQTRCSPELVVPANLEDRE